MEDNDLNNGDPVYTEAQRFLHLHSHHVNPDTTICSYFLTNGALHKHITKTHIVSLLHLHAAKIGFQCLGLYPQNIGSHSLCLGGTTTLH